MRKLKGVNYSAKKNYSVSEIGAYDPVRHISAGEAYSLVKDQEDVNLPLNKLQKAIEKNKIKIYEFKGKKYLDRLDIGRIYHQSPEKKEGLTIERYFSKEGENPFDSVGEYHILELSIKDWNTGKIVFNMPDAYFPKSWDNQVANQIVAQKYFFKPYNKEWKQKMKEIIGVDHENSPVHLINRVTNFIVDEGAKIGYFKTEKDKEIFRDELKWLQINRMFAFNSPVQFNAGIYNKYGISGSTGINYWRDSETGKVASVGKGGCYFKPQSHACFIKGPMDDLESIVQHTVNEAAIFSNGSGIGQDIGVLREEGAPLSGGGKASGPLSFLKIYDDHAGTIKSGGKSRRAARMTTMRYDHPDVIKFIRGKVREDKKAFDLMKLGYSTGMEGEAVTTVTYQNTNISVRIENDFFEKVENGGRVQLKSVVDGSVVGEMEAKKMLQEIAFGSWRIGDPAIQYDTKIQEMHPCKNSGKQLSTNPCSEYLFLNDTSCNLASHNLLEYADKKGNLNIKEFQKAVKLTAIACDILNDASSYPVKDIAQISPEFRTIGIGYCNLGSLLMRKGLAYDSEEGRDFTGAITALMTGTAYETSIEMSEKLEPFTHFEFNKKPFIEVMEKHKKNLDDLLWENVKDDKLKESAYSSWKNVVNLGKIYGFRNAQTTVLAPTGTIAFLMQADTTGIEPAISLKITKNLAGGGNVTLVNQEVPNALKNLNYKNSEIEEIKKFVLEKNKVVSAPYLKPEHYKIFDTAFGDGKGKGTISLEGHVKMLGAAQPFISGAISKTCNLPEHATVKDIYDSYLFGSKIGLKALAVFRNNSKPTAALSFGERGFKELKRGEVEEPLGEREGPQIEVKIGQMPLHMLIGEYLDGRPAQITFLSYKAGSTLKALLETHGIAASKALKRGVHLEDVVSGWIGQKFEPDGFVTIENPQGSHPHIKQALSPLDFAGKWLKLNYLGDKSAATEPEKVDITKLRGFKNGAFRTYEREKIDSWDVEQVLNDPEYGGFTEFKSSDFSKKTNEKTNGELKNSRGVICAECGNSMRQTSPNCYSCSNCGGKIGGCGI
ncbi:ribonucleoside-diphosphate reductase, adenosylcobalamin-dependent [Candidatus Nomurabacteria bacterium RIFCSPLOWO2_01_FULL_33_24]|uniref:Vitamin B12-dependent ribonucleotide reductase n=1 Tax=Candidatus Nomurabacteria bacterium RIFCSPLOWO2_01_FULL_33_24 TaxID=1801765 RepID=A0A1F6X0F1_9BACT|nr:MAG: ribonucleoside-diphosphate reductase, adenosylcobalamin-dependent [Candidatus Nomurabacteria bacterium RIFCSPLOWO2_01_FULL_33_24]